MKRGEQPLRAGTLELEHDLRAAKLIARVQRCAQGLLILFLLAGVAGGFGGGWLGRVRQTDASGLLTVEHPRFARRLSAYELRLGIDPRLAAAGEVAVWIDTALLDSLQLEGIRPRPWREESAAGRVVFRFPCAAGDAVVPVVFHAKTQRMGLVRAEVGVIGGPEVHLVHFVFP